MKLYDREGTSNAARIRIVLAEKVDWRRQPFHPRQPDPLAFA